MSFLWAATLRAAEHAFAAPSSCNIVNYLFLTTVHAQWKDQANEAAEPSAKNSALADQLNIPMRGDALDNMSINIPMDSSKSPK